MTQIREISTEGCFLIVDQKKQLRETEKEMLHSALTEKMDSNCRILSSDYNELLHYVADNYMTKEEDYHYLGI